MCVVDPIRCASQYLLQIFGRGVYNIVFHPLRKVPGPRLRAASYLPNALSVWSGEDFFNTKNLHDKYGPVVRIAPDYLSFDSAAAFQGGAYRSHPQCSEAVISTNTLSSCLGRYLRIPKGQEADPKRPRVILARYVVQTDHYALGRCDSDG